MTSRIRFSLAISALTLALAACQPAANTANPAAHTTETTPATQADAYAAGADTHDAHAAHGEAIPMPPPPVKRWATDAPLREGMDGIANALAQAQAAKKTGNFGAEQANALVAAINQQFQFMLAHCELEPEADAALHILVAQLVAGAERLQIDPTSTEAMAHLETLLAAYPRYFAHENWNPSSSR